MSPESSPAVSRSETPTSGAEDRTDQSRPDARPSLRPQGDELPLDLTFELLKNYRRRVVLRLLEDEPTTTLSTLAEQVAAEENGKPVGELSSAERKRVYISLYQCHLPKLDDAGVIDFDSNRGTVERRELAGHFAPYLDQVTAREGEERPWHRYYVGLALAGGGLLLGQQVLVPTAVATAGVAGLLVVAVAICALLHTRQAVALPD